MMQPLTLRVVPSDHQAAHRLMVERRAREQRVEARSVDRAVLLAAPVPRWSEEALAAGELDRQRQRAAITVAERLAAWRALEAMVWPRLVKGAR